jgi:molybdenum transport protein
MYTIGDQTLDRWLQEDAPYGDLTTWTLGLRSEPGRITFTSRESTVICGTEEVRRILEKCGAQTDFFKPSGEQVGPKQQILSATGPVEALHLGWKVSVNILEYFSGIATRTRKFVDLAKGANPKVEVVATRKGIPGARELSVKAVLAGGGFPHRLGLSESILVFGHHRAFFKSFDAFLAQIPELKTKVPEKKFIVEADGTGEALKLARAGVDGIQFDKTPVEELTGCVKELRSLRPGLTLIAAGGINEHNIAAYAGTGVDTIATSASYFGKPSDIGVKITPLK